MMVLCLNARLTDLTEGELFALYADEGNQDAFTELHDRYYFVLSAYLHRFMGSPSEVEDLMQDVFLNVAMRHAQFDRTQSLRNWIMAVAQNLAMNRLRNEKRRRKALGNVQLSALYDEDDGDVDFEDDRVLDPADEVDIANACNDLRKMMLLLPEKKQRIIEAVYLQGMSHREAAEALGISKGLLTETLTEAKRDLAELLAPVDEDYPSVKNLR